MSGGEPNHGDQYEAALAKALPLGVVHRLANLEQPINSVVVKEDEGSHTHHIRDPRYRQQEQRGHVMSEHLKGTFSDIFAEPF